MSSFKVFSETSPLMATAMKTQVVTVSMLYYFRIKNPAFSCQIYFADKDCSHLLHPQTNPVKKRAY